MFYPTKQLWLAHVFRTDVDIWLQSFCLSPHTQYQNHCHYARFTQTVIIRECTDDWHTFSLPSALEILQKNTFFAPNLVSVWCWAQALIKTENGLYLRSSVIITHTYMHSAGEIQPLIKAHYSQFWLVAGSHWKLATDIAQCCCRSGLYGNSRLILHNLCLPVRKNGASSYHGDCGSTGFFTWFEHTWMKSGQQESWTQHLKVRWR